jgi:PAS domain S-box-containing protein
MVITAADFGSIQLVDPVSSTLRTVAQRGFPQWWVDLWNSVPDGNDTSGASFQWKERVIVENLEQSPIFGGVTLAAQLKVGVRAVQSTPLISRSGKPLGIFSTYYRRPQRRDDDKLRLLDLLARQAADIIEHVQAIAILRESEERFRTMADAMPVVIWLTDADGNTQFVNRAYTEFFGVTLEDVRSRGWQHVLHPDDAEAYVAEYMACLRERRFFRAEARVRRTDGEWRWVESVGQPRKSTSGTFLGIAGSSMDMTEHRRVEEAGRQQASLLRLSFDAIIVWRFDSGIESWSRGAEALYGFTDSEVIGKKTHDLLRTISPVSRSEIEMVLKDKGKWEGELCHRAKDGQEVTVFSRLECLRGDDGTVRVMEINRDITERNRLQKGLTEEGRSKDEFLSLLGHELRTPLAAISTAAQLLSGGGSDEQRVFLNKMIERQVKLMRRVLDDLVDLGGITHGYIQLKKSRIDLASFLQRITEVTQSITAERGQEMILRLPSEIVRFKADEARLEQITINLLNNASKYTPRGGWVELSGVREGSEIVIRCKDNGRGIAHEMQQKIFEPFTRIEPFSDSHGEASLGIGLALAKRLVELHGGTIAVESGGPGMGSAFVVRLPLESAAPDQPVVGEAKPVLTSRHSRLVVVIEDNSDMAAAMLVALERAGYRVTRFGNAFSALAGLSTLKPYAVLLDIGLPGMDGYKLAATLRQKPHLRHAMFIGLSGFKRREATERGDDFDHYFNKPLDLSALLTVLDSFTPPGAAEGVTVRRIMEKVEPIRVLLIDDHAELLAATAALVHQEGLDVLTVQSGREGLDALPDFSPQLILCDLNLSDMPGQEVIRLLRAHSPNQHIYAAVLTAVSDEEILELNREAASMGVDEFISKPLTSEAIRMLVSKLKRREK